MKPRVTSHPPLPSPTLQQPRPRQPRSWLLWPLVAALLPACFGSTTPLAPGLAGSIGMPHHGIQTNATELPPKGPGYRRFRQYDPVHWGNPRLVNGIIRAAAEVDRLLPGGAPLVVGDLSARAGGRVPRHRSHRTGRDADLLWYVTTAEGAPTENPGFIHVGSDALARVPDDPRHLLLDVPREWLLIKTLLRDKELNVQFLFASRGVEAILIEYARARGEPLDLIWQAETVLLQPGDSATHDDHLHLRVACAPEESIRGCEGGGPYWEWLPERPALGPLSAAQLAEIGRADPLESELVAEEHAGRTRDASGT